MNDGDRALEILGDELMSLDRWARKCRDDGDVFDREHNAQALHRADVGYVRKLMNERRDDHGLPVVGITTREDVDGNSAVAARQLWLLPDYEENVAERIRNRDGNHIMAVRLARECQERYGQSPTIPSLPEV